MGDRQNETSLAAQPDFVDRWLSIHPVAATTALLVADAARAVNGEPPDLAKTKSAYDLLCETYAPGSDRAPQCAALKRRRESTLARS